MILINKKNLLLFSFLIVISASLFSQGVMVNELTSNGALIQKANDLKLRGMSLRSGGSPTDTLSLGTTGFLDDFSNEGPYPDTARWLDNYVYVNRDLPIAPPTLGAATFDGVNSNGYPYDFLAGQYTSGKADTLTSKPIDLYLPGDTSVYFSFFYQPQGRGNFPDPNDSLILEFKDPQAFSGAWKHVWATKGVTSALTDSTWKLVMIHITDSIFLQKGFQFRFTNWATLSGNGDHWNLDYVYLKNNRAATDTIFKDVSFVYNTPSLLKTYSVMPWEQYDTTFMKTQYSTTIRNNNNATSFGGFGYSIYDENNVLVNTPFAGGGLNYDPFSIIGYDTNSIARRPPLNYKIPSPMTGKTSYAIKSYLNSSPNNNFFGNDTVTHTQTFDNFYAYDDGTAEVSFALYGALHAQMAIKYKLNVPDTLRAVDIYFNPQWTDASAYTIKLRVWGMAGSGAPGPILYVNSSIDTPFYNQTGRNRVTRYLLDAPLYLPGGTTFFVGFDQNTTQYINVGVDKNTNAQAMAYYNTGGTWNHFPDPGTLMIHPVLGMASSLVGIDENAPPEKEELTVYPNPANDKLFIRSNLADASNKMGYTIIDLFGRTVMENNNSSVSEPIDLSGLSGGVYFIRVRTDKTISTKKFIISR